MNDKLKGGNIQLKKWINIKESRKGDKMTHRKVKYWKRKQIVKL